MSKFCMGCMEQFEDNINICPHCGYEEGTDPVQALHMKPGTILHERYIVGKALGFGGFGVTYIGWDALLENKIAIKEFLPSEFSTRMPGVSYVTVYSGDKYKQFNTGLDRFIEEAKKLAQLNNVENIVAIYDCFKENNTAYIIMEYLEGETIAERLKRDKKIPYSEAIRLLLPIIDALSVVHEHDILHRDIAPDNIFVTKDNKIKLLDFGAARYATTSHSRSLTVIIKPGYSPEEQYRSNGDQGTYTDVYAVAATLYKLITGITPSDALERRANIESKNKDSLKPLVQYCSDIDENTENAILNAMNVRIEDRTPTMAAFKEELTSLTPVKRIAGKIRKIDLLRWPLWAKIAIPVLSALILVIGVLFARGIIGFSSGPNENIKIADGMTRVPSLINETVSDADERLKDAVLIYIISGKEYSDDIPADYVLTQDISAGSIVAQNSIVNIIVSGGDSNAIEKDFMADLTFMTEDKAKEILKSQGFTPEIKYSTSETVGEGLVISQNIEHGKHLNSGDKIQLVVSTGQPSFTMPNVAGKSENDARKVLSDSGLTCTVEYVFSNSVAKGTVITQSISANAQVKKGTNVALTVSNGAVSITSVSIKSNPTKTSYYVGETLNTSGLTLTAIYNDGSTKTITSGFTCTPTALTSAGTKTIAVSYSGKTTTFTVKVEKKPTEYVRKIKWEDINAGCSYNGADKLTGFLLQCMFTCDPHDESGFTADNSFGAEISHTPVYVDGHKYMYFSFWIPDDSTFEGWHTVTLYHDGTSETVQFYLDFIGDYSHIIGTSKSADGLGWKVTEWKQIIKGASVPTSLTSISVKSLPTKTSYYVGDTLNTSGLTLTAKYTNGSTETISSGFECSHTLLSSIGENMITVHYKGLATTFTVYVEEQINSGVPIYMVSKIVKQFGNDNTGWISATLVADIPQGASDVSWKVQEFTDQTSLFCISNSQNQFDILLSSPETPDFTNEYYWLNINLTYTFEGKEYESHYRIEEKMR